VNLQAQKSKLYIVLLQSSANVLGRRRSLWNF